MSAEKKPKGSWWAETKSDLKWASVLLIGAVIAGPLLLSLAGFGGDPWPAWAAPAEAEEDMPAITDAIFTTQLVPFEILSVLLLAALVAGVVIAFRDPEGA